MPQNVSLIGMPQNVSLLGMTQDMGNFPDLPENFPEKTEMVSIH